MNLKATFTRIVTATGECNPTPVCYSKDMLITLNNSNADDHTLFLCDMYWDWDEDAGEGQVELSELQQHATLNPATGKWESSPPQ